MGKIILTISIILKGLSSYGQTNQDIYQLFDYVLVRTDSTSRGLDKKLYVNRFDTARRMLEEYYDDGTILFRSFSYKGKLEGNLESFQPNGRPLAMTSFHNGVKGSTRYLIPRDTTTTNFFSNGKLRPLKDDDVDSLLKK